MSFPPDLPMVMVSSNSISAVNERLIRHSPVVAQAALTGTLLKFNSGLVELVSSFLANPKSKSHCDFGPLIRLSDDSRREAVDALTQLYQRLSSSRPLRPGPGQHSSQDGKPRRSKSTKQASSSSKAKSSHKPRESASTPRKSASNPVLTSKPAPTNTTVTKVNVKGFKAPQYAYVRQKGSGRRSSSGSSVTNSGGSTVSSSGGSTVSSCGGSTVSSSSRSSQSTALTTPSSSPGSSPYIGIREESPPPQYESDVSADPSTRPPPISPRAKLFAANIRQTPYFYAARSTEPEMTVRAPASSPLLPTTSPSYPHFASSPPQPPYPTSLSLQDIPTRSTRAPVTSNNPHPAVATRHSHSHSHPHPYIHHQTHSHPNPNPRASVAYSFASDSTKLGEIPLHRWTEPAPDYDAMERANREAARYGWAAAGPPPVPEPARRRGGGFWSLFKKGVSGAL